MPSAEERKVHHLANIGNYLHDLVVVMKEINRNLEDLAKIAKELNETEQVKVLRPEEWMNELKRWWNYNAVGNINEMKLTETEFFSYMNQHGTEVTAQVRRDRPDLFEKEGE
jgi:hypothetical protein